MISSCLTLNFLALPVGPYVELEMLESFNDILPQMEPIPIAAIVPASAVAIAPGTKVRRYTFPGFNIFLNLPAITDLKLIFIN